MKSGGFEALCRASLAKGYEPETSINWTAPLKPDDAVLPEGALSIADLPEVRGLDLRRKGLLARHEVAATFSVSIRFEDTLMRRLIQDVQHADPLAPELPYYLHVVEEEARHNRMFIRLIRELGVGAYPAKGALGLLQHMLFALVRWSEPVFFLAVFGVEEITDQIFRDWISDPSTHPIVRDVCRIHRIEEARHRSFSRASLEGAYAGAGATEKGVFVVAAPMVVNLIFDFLVPPSVYVRAGLAGSHANAWRIWCRARGSASRRRLRLKACAPVVRILKSLGAAPATVRPLWTAAGLDPRRFSE